jgi:hypothetical protein
VDAGGRDFARKWGEMALVSRTTREEGADAAGIRESSLTHPLTRVCWEILRLKPCLAVDRFGPNKPFIPS